MSTTQEEPTLQELLSRVAALEQANVCLHEELTILRAERAAAEEQASRQRLPRRSKSSRRHVLTTGLGVVVASAGVEALLGMSGGTAFAKPKPSPGVFASDIAGTPAVSAMGTNGADGMDATSDSGIGVSATSTSGTGLVATSSSGLAGHFVGNVSMDNNLTVTGALSSGASSSASSVVGMPAVKATGTNGADGIDASSDSGTGLLAKSSSGLAGHFVGNVSMDNNLNVAGTLNGGVGTFASSVSSTPAVKANSTSGADGLDASSDSGDGVVGQSTSGTGVFGQSTSSNGVIGESSSGNGVLGSSGSSDGVLGESNSGNGVHGFSSTGTGVLGESSTGTGVVATSGIGVGLHAVGGATAAGTPPFGRTETAIFAESRGNPGLVATSSSDDGVIGSSSGGSSAGVIGLNSSGSSNSSGVTGSSTGSGTGVVGASISGTGVFGTSSNGLAGLFEGNVQVNGNFAATGTKNFVQAHPTDPSREIVYVALEGGEAGTYVRGTGTLVNGKAVLALPGHFGLVTSYEDLTIQLTPRGEWLQLYMVELDTAQAIVREAQGKSGAFDYLICGVRKGYEQHEVLRTKR